MTTKTTPTVQMRAPGRSRQPVLFEPPEIVVATLKASPGTVDDPDSGWHLIAARDRTRLGVISQTSYRIRNGKIQAFVVTEDEPGRFETMVSTDTKVPDRKADVELYARWVPAG
jgi:hypothetical protein